MLELKYENALKCPRKFKIFVKKMDLCRNLKKILKRKKTGNFLDFLSNQAKKLLSVGEYLGLPVFFAWSLHSRKISVLIKYSVKSQDFLF